MIDVTCNHFRELISARLDGELDGDDAAMLTDHLAGCSSCAAYEDQAEAQRRAFRLNAAEQLSDVELSRPSVVGSLAAVSFLRWALFVIGGTLIALNAVNLVFTVDAVDQHLGRHDAVFGTALGIGMVTVAWKPQRAIGLVPLTSAITVLMGVAAVRDLADSQTSMISEATHVIEFAGLICLWVISGGVARLQDRATNLFRGARRSTVPQWPTA